MTYTLDASSSYSNDKKVCDPSAIDPSGSYGYSSSIDGYADSWVAEYYGSYYWWGYASFTAPAFQYYYGYVDYPYSGYYYTYYQYGSILVY